MVMRAALAAALAAGACLVAAAPAASAPAVTPKSSVAFRDSVGVATHIGYYDTAYADWPRLVARLEALGVRHLRDGVYGNPSPQAAEYNRRFYESVDLAAAHGMRFTFIMGGGGDTGTLDQLIDVVSGRLRHAVEALEAPNEVDKAVGGPRWASRLAAYTRRLYRKVKATPSLRRLPVLAPSLATFGAERRLGDQRKWLDVGNVHPYTGGESPHPLHLHSALAEASRVSGPHKPIWATEAGFHNALNQRTAEHPPVSEHAAAVYLLRTFLEHFHDGIRRTYAYELIDEVPEPRRRNPEYHFGLLRHDYSPKPAYRALRSLLTLVGREDRRPRLRPLRLGVSGAGPDVRRLVLQKADGTYLVALWRTARIWDTARRRRLRVRPRALTVTLPGAGRVELADPVASAATRRLRLRGQRVRVGLGARPLVLVVKRGRAAR
jgi:hypothetical protein